MADDAPGGPKALDETSFDSFVQENAISLVDFWAPWCGPCKRVDPIVAELASEMAGQVAFGKLNTDEAPGPAQKFGVMSIPTLLIFKDGQVVDQIVGAVPKTDIVDRLNKHL